VGVGPVSNAKKVGKKIVTMPMPQAYNLLQLKKCIIFFMSFVKLPHNFLWIEPTSSIHFIQNACHAVVS
jgi:hypothetical protein